MLNGITCQHKLFYFTVVLSECNSSCMLTLNTKSKSGYRCYKSFCGRRARASKSRTQSPCSPGLHHPSSMRHRATTPSDGPRRLEGEEKAAAETRGSSTLDRKNTKSENSERKMPKSASRDLGDRNAGELLTLITSQVSLSSNTLQFFM